jgi:UDP-2,4-diacetamido-2,4,6-trideoxy-beta-L-altropyranose hydrolase
MRCLTLAGALAARGVACRVALGEADPAAAERFALGPLSLERGGAGERLAQQAADWLVLDDYSLSYEEEKALGVLAGRVLVIDDLVRAHCADLLLDPSFGRRAEEYEGLLPDGCRRLTGPAYALLRPSFARLRSQTLARPIPPSPRRIFASFGLSDVGSVALRSARVIRAVFPDAALDMALASDAPSASPLERLSAEDPLLSVHPDAKDVAALLAGADLAVGAGGVSTWERCCLGRPAVAVVVADNQREMIAAMSRQGLLVSLDLEDPDFDATLTQALREAASPSRGRTLAARSAALCDGLGADRVADALLGS